MSSKDPIKDLLLEPKIENGICVDKPNYCSTCNGANVRNCSKSSYKKI